MKTHTNEYKENVKFFGRQIDSKITYTLNNELIELGADVLNSVTPYYEGSILKSVMKQLEIDSNEDIPLNTTINYQFGVMVNDSYEYINFGDYVVYKSEKQEDLKSYKITCYDKMLYSMKDYEAMGITYPITIRNYISAICNHLGLTFKNSSDTFANYDKQIASELYLDSQGNSLGYTFRDVLDELAQVTASTICINEDDGELEVRYINDTGDTIDEEYLKDINVTFGELYGPVNTIVLSRSADSDKIYLSYPENIPDDDKIAIEIKDNQIMNGNNRDVYMSDILNRLLGLQYYINDFLSTGITYYNLCDRYNIQIGEQTYSCVMFNDEINVTQGLEEKIYTNMPEEAETDYNKADKTDRRINQTYLIVDKQNQTIEGVVSQIDEQNEQIADIRLQYNELISRISDIADITTSGESMIARVPLTDVNASQPISIKIHPIGENISYLYPYNGLYPSDTLYMKSRTLLFTNTTTHETFPWELPTDLWYYDSTTYDELELSYGDGTNSNVIVTRRCQINADGTVSVLATPTTETYAYPSDLVLTDGDYNVELLGYNTGYLYVQLMAKNIYTTQFYTKAETNSVIDQKADEINFGVTQTLSNYSTTEQMNSAINLKANEITSTVSETYATKTTTNQLSSRISQTAKGISLTVNNGSTSSGITIGVTKEDGTTEQTSGTIQMNGLVKFTDLSTSGQTTINGSNITTGIIKSSNYVAGTSGTSINLSNGVIDTKGFKVNSSGNITATSGKIGGWNLNQDSLSATNGNYQVILANISNAYQDFIVITNGNNYPFWVRGDGTFYAGNATIRGNITATSGSFTGSIYANQGTFNNVTIYSDCNINGSAIKSGSISSIPYSYNTGSESVILGNNSDGPIMGYRGSSPRWSLASFTNGGRFQTFDGNGNMAAYFNQTGSHTSSDIRYKKHVKNITEKESIDIIKNLTPIEYDYDTEEKHRGLSAQEVEKVLLKNGFKNQVYNIEKDGKYTLNYTELIPDLINCIKYLNNKIEKIERESDK